MSIKLFFALNVILIMGSFFDGLSTYYNIANGLAVEVNPFMSLRPTLKEIIITIVLLPLLISVLTLPLLKLSDRVKIFLQGTGASFFTKIYNDDKKAQNAFLLASVPVCLGLAKLVAVLNNTLIILGMSGFVSRDGFFLFLAGSLLFFRLPHSIVQNTFFCVSISKYYRLSSVTG